ncbi:hypothetical protein FJY70_02280 [candidate division WOR-3 bacterium]|nr:hypothetical protein [candidate division WOR-3 bacterium]
MSQETFGGLVKAVVDVKRGIMAVDADLHADEEAELVECGSEQYDLWGINLYPDRHADQWVEFDSVINIRPLRGNRSRGVDDPATRNEIIAVVSRLVAR